MFNQEKREKFKKTKRLKILGIFILVLQALSWLFLFLYPKRWKRFLKGQKREIEELSEGKEDFGRFCRDSGKLLKDLFVPYEGNEHKPKSLRPKTLVTYIVVAIMVKILVTGFLFVAYPSPAELAAIISSNMINLVNVSRSEAGLEPLKENLTLAGFAGQKGKNMIEDNYFAHNSPTGKKPWQWINRGEYDYVYAGENLAMDFTSAEVVHSAFMKSPTHRKNILNPKYKEVGMAVINGELDGRQTILLVEFFGTQRKDLSTLAEASAQKTEAILTSDVQPAEIELETGTAAVAGQAVEEAPGSVMEIFNPQPLNEGIIVVATETKSTKALVDFIVEYSNIFFIAFLIFILISLALNIFVKIRVQHASVILQSIAVAALLLAMTLVKFHFVEKVAPQLLIL